MSLSLPAEVQIEDHWPVSYTVRLPRRDLGALRWAAVALCVLGVLVASLIVYAIAAAVSGVDPRWHRHIFGLLVFIGVPTLGGLLPMFWGLALLFGRNELTIEADYLVARSYLGPLFRTKRWRVSEVSTLSVTSLLGAAHAEHLPTWLRSCDTLRGSVAVTNQVVLAWGYPREVLEPVALLVGERCDLATRSTANSATHKPVGVYSDYSGVLKQRLSTEEMQTSWDDDDASWTDEPATTVPHGPPSGSDIEVETFADGLTIRIPPAGLRKGTSGLFTFSLVWNGAMLLFTTLFVFAMFNHQANNDGMWVVIGFLALFWAVGIGTLCGALNMGWRKAAIAVAGDSLMVMQTGPFGKKSKDWPLSDLVAIKAGPSGIRVNDVDVVELQIHAIDDSKFGLLAGRATAEVEWLASLLHPWAAANQATSYNVGTNDEQTSRSLKPQS